MSSRDNLSVLRARTLPRVRNRVQRASKAQIEQMLFRFWLGRLEYRGVNRTKTDTDIKGCPATSRPNEILSREQVNMLTILFASLNVSYPSAYALTQIQYLGLRGVAGVCPFKMLVWLLWAVALSSATVSYCQCYQSNVTTCRITRTGRDLEECRAELEKWWEQNHASCPSVAFFSFIWANPWTATTSYVLDEVGSFCRNVSMQPGTTFLTTSFENGTLTLLLQDTSGRFSNSIAASQPYYVPGVLSEVAFPGADSSSFLAGLSSDSNTTLVVAPCLMSRCFYTFRVPSPGMSPAAIAGIVIGALAGILVLVTVVVLLCKRRRAGYSNV